MGGQHLQLLHHASPGRARFAGDASDSEPRQTLSTITRAGTPVSYTTDTIKGIAYAFFPAATGSYAAVYAP